jgi:hypothetical protein
MSYRLVERSKSSGKGLGSLHAVSCLLIHISDFIIVAGSADIGISDEANGLAIPIASLFERCMRT